MQQRNCRLLFSPSDLSAFLACRHLARLELGVARGEIARPDVDDADGELIRRKGDEHERAHLEALLADRKDVVTIFRGEREEDWDLERAARETEVAMRAGAEVIYQGVLVSPDGWRGLAAWSYEVADTKLARRPKPAHLLQLCFYSAEVARLQGVEPAQMHLVLGSGERESFRPADFDAYFRRARRRFLEFVAAERVTYPLPVDHCSICDFLPRCEQQWIDDDHLTLVVRMRRDQIARLEDARIERLATLATTPPGTDVPRMAPATFESLRHQAELQLYRRETGSLRYDLLAYEEKRGLAALPEPSTGDVFFDIEGDPWWEPERGLEYLFGVLWREGNETRYGGFWAHDRDSERRAFEELVDFLHERLEADPDMHVYHYAHYETTALKRLMGEYGTREDALDDLLRRQVFVDIYAVVRQAVLASVPGYGLKEIERFYFDAREADVASGGDSVVDYERWIESREQALLDGIEAYNREDCLSTLGLREWLLGIRNEAAGEWGHEVPWRGPPDQREEKPEAEEIRTEKERLRAALLARADGEDALWLLAQLLDYHRREAKPAWWWFFRRLTLTSRELVDDAESIGELEWDGAEPEEDGSARIFIFSFPDQEHRLDEGDGVVDPLTGKGAGTIVGLDEDARRLRLRRPESLEDVPLPRALVPGGPYSTPEQQAALRRLARSVVDRDGGYAALKRILRGELPLDGLRVQRETLDEMRELVG